MGLGLSKESERALAEMAANIQEIRELLEQILAQLKSQKEKNHGS